MQYAVKVSVAVRDEIRLFQAPSNTKKEQLLDWARREVEDEFKDVGLVYNIEVNPIPITELDREAEKLN